MPSEKKVIEEYYLEMWPGYETMTKNYCDGIFLNVDTATKFINKLTVLEEIDGMLDKRYSKSDIVAHFAPDNNKGRVVVITSYNNSMSYQIDGITFDQTPENHVFSWDMLDKSSKQWVKQKTNLVEYFHIKYNIKIKDVRQPLLFVNKRG